MVGIIVEFRKIQINAIIKFFNWLFICMLTVKGNMKKACSEKEFTNYFSLEN
jgi:hypothetical protein